MKERWSLSKVADKLNALESGQSTESDERRRKKCSESKTCCKSSLKYLKPLIYVQLAILLLWVGYEMWQIRCENVRGDVVHSSPPLFRDTVTKPENKSTNFASPEITRAETDKNHKEILEEATTPKEDSAQLRKVLLKHLYENEEKTNAFESRYNDNSKDSENSSGRDSLNQGPEEDFSKEDRNDFPSGVVKENLYITPKAPTESRDFESEYNEESKNVENAAGMYLINEELEDLSKVEKDSLANGLDDKIIYASTEESIKRDEFASEYDDDAEDVENSTEDESVTETFEEDEEASQEYISQREGTVGDFTTKYTPIDTHGLRIDLSTLSVDKVGSEEDSSKAEEFYEEKSVEKSYENVPSTSTETSTNVNIIAKILGGDTEDLLSDTNSHLEFTLHPIFLGFGPIQSADQLSTENENVLDYKGVDDSEKDEDDNYYDYYASDYEEVNQSNENWFASNF